MNNHPAKETLALYATGDLDASELKSIAEHMAACEACRDCAAQFEQVAGMLASLAGEPSNQDLHEVRQRVLSALSNKRRRRSYFQWAAAAAALAMTALWFQHKQPASIESPRIERIQAGREPAPAAVLAREIPVARHKRRMRPAGLRSVALINAGGEAPSIKITTADPSIVILLPPNPQDSERTQTNDE